MDLTNFSDTCVYCYKDIGDNLIVCTCGNSLCDLHSDMHQSKFGCRTHYTVSLKPNGEVKVESSEDLGDLEERINIKIKNGMVSNGQKRDCRHIYKIENKAYELKLKETKCSDCDVNENLWICLDCNHIGCGRKQEGIIGNGHALEHFKKGQETEKSKHHTVALLSSIENGNGDTFCYTCDDFVHNPINLEIKVENEQKKTFNDFADEDSKKCIDSDILGIKNEFQNCYISSTLHLISECIEDYDLSEHFFFCEMNPRFCLCCQFVKIMNEMKTLRNGIKTVRITEFLNCVYEEMPLFKRNNQEDPSDFLNMLLERISVFEECMLIPKITDIFEFTIKCISRCKTCGNNKENQLKSKILDTPFGSTYKQSLISGLQNKIDIFNCCGDVLNQIVFINLPRVLIVNLSRFDLANNKIKDPIDACDLGIRTNCTDAFIINEKRDGYTNFKLIGAIRHRGDETTRGHYTWWVKKENGIYLANDSIITRSDEDYPKYGSIFLMKTWNK